MKSFYSNGKLLVSAEYAILDGAKGLALPTKFGQLLTVKKSNTGEINWRSLNEQNHPWFTADIDIKKLNILNTSDTEIANRLITILKETKKLNPSFLQDYQGVYLDADLTFPKDWGLGSSSTLINNIAQWANVDPYKLLGATFGGSGYDIACAQNNTPITFQLVGGIPQVEPVSFNPTFKENLFFVYLNRKQNSRAAIAKYRLQQFDVPDLIMSLTAITEAMVQCQNLSQFELLIQRHELLLSMVLQVPPVKQVLFKDYFGEIKSLGAWGGDFVLVTGNASTPEYFIQRDYTTILSYSEMVY